MVPGVEDTSHAQGVQIGDGNVQNNYFYGGRRSVMWPHRVGVVPMLADHHQWRPVDDELAAAAAGETVVVCQVVAGLGGVGKTQLAAALADTLWRERQVDLLVWVSATFRSSVVNSYTQAAADVTGVEDADPEQAAARLLSWLAGTDRRWLVVLDDLANPADAQPVAANCRYGPDGGHDAPAGCGPGAGADADRRRRVHPRRGGGIPARQARRRGRPALGRKR
jgi:hypothetical protein